MKFNRILSTVIIFVMLFTSIIAVFPVGALAAEDNGSGVTVTMLGDNDLITDEAQIKAIANEALGYTFATAEEMLNYELEKKYLVSAANSKFTIYVNVYTGFLYYKNNATGQIITSNPIDAGDIKDDKTKTNLMSQIELTYKNKADNSSESTFTSMQWIKSGSFITVREIPGAGISVEYTLGEANTNFIAPAAVLYDDFMESLATPMFTKLASLMEAACGAFDADKVSSTLDVLKKQNYINYVKFADYNIAHENNKESFDKGGNLKVTGVADMLTAMSAYATSVATDPAKKQAVVDYVSSLSTIFSNYSVVDKAKYPANLDPLSAVEDGATIFLLKAADNLTTKQIINKAMRATVPEYTLEQCVAHENACGYASKVIVTPTFNCVINYTLDSDGILGVDIPVSPDVLTFNNAHYALTSFTPLKYFGAGNMDNDGYIFYPDGSGTIVEFDDFYFGSNSGKGNPNIGVDAPLYGNDYIYSEIKGAHREQISMPVFGLVNDVNVNASTVPNAGGKAQVTNGFFTVIEEGSAIANLGFVTNGSAHKYATVYTKFTPYPSDKIDLSETISVSANNFYYKISDIGYQGSCKFRVNMLSDASVATSSGYAQEKSFYNADYSGMAACYRDYLTDKGDISALTEITKDIPLYLEALGSIDVTKRILTFPVTVSTALTSFEDVKNVYNDLSDITDAVQEFKDKAAEYKALADEKAAEGSLNDNERRLIKDYLAKSERYTALAEKIQNISNINFRLTGFANGGMYFTYPAKVRWENSVGGKRGLEDLISYSKEVGSSADKNLGIYPDFDFLFINNTALFDGINHDGTAARMIDNRFASKQAYDSIQQEYESLFALVISADSLDELYGKFNRDYSKLELKNLSVATLGSILNSNMDEKNTVNREDSLGYVSDLLGKMNKADGDNYSLMTDIGNAYSLKYVDHILNASIDSSHFRYSSYTVPFYGMVLHGSVNYAGSPINYSGSPDYDILRSIENGASLYYIICCSNTNYLKEDKLLSDYYGIDYANWEEKILEQYALLNGAIGDLQQYNITSHRTLIVERVIDADELYTNIQRLTDELVANIDSSISAEIDRVIKDEPNTELKGFVVDVNEAEVLTTLTDLLTVYAADIERAGITDRVADLVADPEDGVAKRINDIIAKYESDYSAEKFEGGKPVVIGKTHINNETKYNYDSKNSVATDRDNYVTTDFTCDNGSVVMVTYSYTNAEGVTDEVVFILNYNNFAVDLTLSDVVYDGAKNYTIGAYGCHRIDLGSQETNGIKIK